jgi:tripartite ATP-independent transporter DctM subunit
VELFIFLLIFLISFSFGFPIAFSMMFSAIFYGVMTGKDLRFFSLEAFSSLDNFILIAIPMFLLTAEVMMSSSIAKRLFNFANSFFGFIHGGLGHVNVATSIIFAGMSGSAMADAGGIGYLSYKSMVDRGFDKPFSAALTASSAMIGPIVPPSIPMIIYAMVASESIGNPRGNDGIKHDGGCLLHRTQKELPG